MDTKHTPGPWALMDTSSWSIEQRRNGPSSVCHVGDFTIVTEGPSYEFHGTDEADARLIAAAPDMLQALRPFDIRWADHPVLSDGLEILINVVGTSHVAHITVGDLRRASAAIAKATNTPSPRPEVLPVTSGDDAVPASDQNAATPGDAGGADLCPGCGLPIHDVKSCDAVHCGVWGEP
jgi:hypothetical protein